MNPEPVSSPANGLRVLVVEDHADSAIAIARLLKAVGHLPQVAGDLHTAKSLAGREGFDLLISDIALPDGTGLELMRHLRQTYAIKGIALSGFVGSNDERDSREAGFSAHLGKPLDFMKLRETIDRVWAGETGDGTAG